MLPGLSIHIKSSSFDPDPEWSSSGEKVSMAATSDHEIDDHDWDKEVEEFEKTKAGVKGLSDSQIKKVPRFFIFPSLEVSSAGASQIRIPVIDFEGVEDLTRRMEIVAEIRKASGSWGFFQIVNHGVPVTVMDSILKATEGFHEQPKEQKMDFYSSDSRRRVRLYTINGKLTRHDVANWRDALACSFTDNEVIPDEIPLDCRKEITDYMNHILKLRDVVSEMLSEALGLAPSFLEQMQCMKSSYLTCLYYPPCPEPDRTLGAVEHSDPTVLNILLQDNVGGLQILHDDNWIDVPPVPGALIANIGDYMQIQKRGAQSTVQTQRNSFISGMLLSPKW